MNYITKIILIVSIGFMLIGIIYFKSEKIKKSLRESGLYKDADSFIKLNGTFNILIGLIGMIVGLSDYFFPQKSRVIVMIFAALIILSSIIQNIYSKKYKK